MVSRRAAPVNFANIGSNQILGGGGSSQSNFMSASKGGNDDYMAKYEAEQDAIFFARYGYSRRSDTLGFPSGAMPEA